VSAKRRRSRNEVKAITMNVLKVILAALATLAGVAGTLMFVVFLLAGSANSKPEDARRIFQWTWAIGIGGLACLIAAIALMIIGHNAVAATVGALPLVAMIAFMVLAAMAS
jgi:hypothetical protein